MPLVRIQKFLAAAGFGARRKCEQLVADGRVDVNGQSVSTLPVLIDLEKDKVRVDGVPVRRQRLVYFMLNKPKGVFCTHDDPAGRTRAVDLLMGVRERIFPVGRLDAETSGLLLFTNDGALAQKLTHPRYGAPKTYRVQVDGFVPEASIHRLREGIWLSEGRTRPARIEVVRRERERTYLEITQREGKNREIQRMLAKMGHKVRRIAHVRIGRLSIKGLPVGAFRPLSPRETEELLRLVAAAPAHDSDHEPRPERKTRAAKPTQPQSDRPIRHRSTAKPPDRPDRTKQTSRSTNRPQPKTAGAAPSTRRTAPKPLPRGGRRVLMPDE